MNWKKTLGIAAIVAPAVLPPASAKEMGAPELFRIFAGMAMQHAFAPMRADASATPGQPEGAGCDAPQEDRQAFRKPALGTPRPGAFCLRQDYVFECAPYGCGDVPADRSVSDFDADARNIGYRRSLGPQPASPARESAP